MDLAMIIEMLPATLAPIVGWLVWRIHTIESTLMVKMREDITEIKNDIKWLIKAHEDEK